MRVVVAPRPSFFQRPVIKTSLSNAVCAGLGTIVGSVGGTFIGRIFFNANLLMEEEIPTLASAAAVGAGALATLLQNKKPLVRAMKTGFAAGIMGLLLAPKIERLLPTVTTTTFKVAAIGGVIGALSKIPANMNITTPGAVVGGVCIGITTAMFLPLSTPVLGTIATASTLAGVAAGVFSLLTFKRLRFY